jgi:hypothetical protein
VTDAPPGSDDGGTVPSGPDDDGSSVPSGPGPTALALRRIRPPEHRGEFWGDLDRRLADEPQLRLAPRAAIRPITQPPPVIDDRHLSRTVAGGTTDVTPPRRPGRRGLLTAVVAGVLALLIAVALVQDPDDDATTDDETASDTSTDRPPASDEATSSTLPTTTLPPGTVDPAAPLDPAGVGPLRIGATFGELQAAGVQIQHDQATFRGSGGTCYDAKVTGALDLRLRFRNPDGTRRVNEPTEGVLAAVGIEAALPTTRVSNGSAIGLGASQEQVLLTYAGNIDERDHPFVPRGKIFRADAGNGLGIAFVTDGATVIGITVGQMDVIRFVNDCR